MKQIEKNTKTESTKYLSRKELSARWICSIETLKRRERAGVLTPSKLGKAVRYLREQVEEIEREAVASR